jgi:methylthioribose-1-phosphate isomerase
LNDGLGSTAVRTVDWDAERGCLLLIDQRLLPGELRVTAFDDYQQVVRAIREMVVRGAPAIGVTAAFGLALAARQSSAEDAATLRQELSSAGEVLLSARPTAVNLRWAVERVLLKCSLAAGSVDDLRRLVLDEALCIAEEDVALNQHMARHGASLIQDGDTIIHHCNTGALAAVDWGTALGAIRMAHTQGKRIHVLVDETRPRLQGSRLTAWELEQYGISYEIIPDNAAGYFLRSGQAQRVFFGADRIAANGDVANKIGTYMLALAAYDNQAPVACVAPISTIDLSTPHGGAIPIEERPAEEVLNIQIDGQRVAPIGARARNPAFDVTPNRLITAIVTEHGVVYPPYLENLPRNLATTEG